jgi:hypothetical protein
MERAVVATLHLIPIISQDESSLRGLVKSQVVFLQVPFGWLHWHESAREAGPPEVHLSECKNRVFAIKIGLMMLMQKS